MRNLAQLAEGALLRIYSVEEAHRLSLVDPLTGLANRRHFDQERTRAWDEMVTSRRPLSLMMLDIDDFKTVNDRDGHAASECHPGSNRSHRGCGCCPHRG